MNETKKLPDIEHEEGAYYEVSKPRWVSICATHTKDNWFLHEKYVDNKDGTISCPKCGWGTKIPGYMKVCEGKIKDLRG